MTDELMDARLRGAGERWRANDPTTTEDLDGTEELLDLRRRNAPRHSRWLALASAAVVAAALLVGGVLFANRQTHNGTGGVVASPSIPLRGTTWIDTMSGATAVFAAKTVRLSNGCLTSTSALTVKGNRMTIGRSRTQSICSPPLPPQTGVFHEQYLLKASADNEFFNAFAGTARWSISGNYMTIRTSSGSTLELATKHGLALSVFDHPWTLKYVIDDNETTDTSPSGSLVFRRDGTVTVFDRCSTFSGSARVTDTTVEFQKMVENAHSCPLSRASAPPINVNDVLNGETSFDLRLGELTITKKSIGTLIYVPQKATTPATSNLIDVDWTLSGTETSTTSGNSSSGSGSSAVSQTVLRFDGAGGFTISHRCYIDKGTAKISAGEVTLSGITLKSAIPCTQPVAGESEQNDFVDTLLNGTVTWSVENHQLTISKGADSATFARGATDATPTLLGFTWQLQSIKQGSGPYGSGSTPTVPITVQIVSGVLRISGDCNPSTGPTELLSGARLAIGTLVTSASTCRYPRLNADQANAISRVLKGTVTYQISGDQLTITKTGVGELVFTKS